MDKHVVRRMQWRAQVVYACLVTFAVLAMIQPDGYSFWTVFIVVALAYGIHMFIRGMFFCGIADEMAAKETAGKQVEGGNLE